MTAAGTGRFDRRIVRHCLARGEPDGHYRPGNAANDFLVQNVKPRPARQTGLTINPNSCIP